MNSMKSQDTKLIYRNQLHFFLLIINTRKVKLKKKKILRNESDQGDETYKLKTKKC